MLCNYINMFVWLILPFDKAPAKNFKWPLHTTCISQFCTKCHTPWPVSERVSNADFCFVCLFFILKAQFRKKPTAFMIFEFNKLWSFINDVSLLSLLKGSLWSVKCSEALNLFTFCHITTTDLINFTRIQCVKTTLAKLLWNETYT